MSIALPPPIATIVSTPPGTSIRCDGTSSQRSAASSTSRQRGLATTSGRSPARPGSSSIPQRTIIRQLGARELDERVGGARRRAAGGARERDLALRVEPFDLRGRERAGRELRLDRRAGDERDAVAGLHGAPHRLLQPELEPDVEVAQPRAEGAQLVLDDLADAGALLHHDQALVAQLVERHGAPGEGVTGRARQDHLVVEERLERDRAVAAGRADDPELELPRGDALDDGLRVRDGQRDLDARMLALELAEEQRDDDRGGAGRGAELELAGQLALALAGDLVEDLPLERQEPLRAAVEPQARLGRLDAAPGAVEQLRRRAASRAPAPAARRRAG